MARSLPGNSEMVSACIWIPAGMTRLALERELILRADVPCMIVWNSGYDLLSPLGSDHQQGGGCQLLNNSR